MAKTIDAPTHWLISFIFLLVCSPANDAYITETWQADNRTGAINLPQMTDHTIGGDGESKLTYPK
jgi:hypothetical protein